MSEPPVVTSVHAVFAGRERKFELRLGEIGELERLCGAGLGAIMLRLATMQWRWDDVRETVRLGLMGGGMSEPDATALAMAQLDKPPFGRFLQLANDIIVASVNGADPPKKAEAETPTSAAPATSAASTKSAPPSDLTPEPSTA